MSSRSVSVILAVYHTNSFSPLDMYLLLLAESTEYRPEPRRFSLKCKFSIKFSIFLEFIKTVVILSNIKQRSKIGFHLTSYIENSLKSLVFYWFIFSFDWCQKLIEFFVLHNHWKVQIKRSLKELVTPLRRSLMFSYLFEINETHETILELFILFIFIYWHNNSKRNIKYLSFLFVSLSRDNLLDCWTRFVSDNKVCLIFLFKKITLKFYEYFMITLLFMRILYWTYSQVHYLIWWNNKNNHCVAKCIILSIVLLY